MNRHENPAAWVADAFRRQARGSIDNLQVSLHVGQLVKVVHGQLVGDGVLVRVESNWSIGPREARSCTFDVWPADVPEIAAVMEAGARMLEEQELRASWDAPPPTTCEGTDPGPVVS